MKKLTQKQQVLLDLQANEGKWVSAWTWVDQRPRILRAGARIHDLRQEGYNIESKWIEKDEQRVYYYRLIAPETPQNAHGEA